MELDYGYFPMQIEFSLTNLYHNVNLAETLTDRPGS